MDLRLWLLVAPKVLIQYLIKSNLLTVFDEKNDNRITHFASFKLGWLVQLRLCFVFFNDANLLISVT